MRRLDALALMLQGCAQGCDPVPDAGAPSGGSCDTAPTAAAQAAFANDGAAMLVCHSTAASTVLHVRVEQ